ncbi:MAG TPA: thioredoxin [Chitinispirillaceae bacterium]|nr:thioredoxin [Chitinispirillaceae bacterium]
MAGADIKEVTDQTFSSEVLSNKLPVVVDFWAEWCGPCKMLTPIIDELATELKGKVAVYKLDIDSNPQTAARYSINSIPTLLFIKNGSIIEQHTGLLAKAPLKNKISKVFQI